MIDILLHVVTWLKRGHDSVQILGKAHGKYIRNSTVLVKGSKTGRFLTGKFYK